MLRAVPCFAFQDGGGKLDRLGRGFIVQGCNRTGRTALRHNVPGTAFAASALGGDTQLELYFVKAHARMRMACDFAVRNPAANTDDHGSEAVVAGWWMI